MTQTFQILSGLLLLIAIALAIRLAISERKLYQAREINHVLYSDWNDLTIHLTDQHFVSGGTLISCDAHCDDVPLTTRTLPDGNVRLIELVVAISEHYRLTHPGLKRRR